MTNLTPPLKIDIINLGCSKNLVDSENLLTRLRNGGAEVRLDPERIRADILIINTCGFIHDAREESVNTILQAVEAKKNGRIKEIRVMGCLVQRYQKDLSESLPEVSKWYTLDDTDLIASDLGLNNSPELLTHRHHTTPSHFAYLKISEGCNRNCSFCAIPSIRGKHISRPIESIVDEAEFLAAHGAKELILIAQDLSYYGKDLYGKHQLPELIRQLTGVSGLEWLRLHYTYPAQFPLEILDLMAQSDRICRYLDIPLQHISDPMLKRMNRGISKQETITLLETIREKVPEVALRTTMLIGHPGETESDQLELLDFVREQKFERLGVFTYSHEEGTTSGDSCKDDIPPSVKAARAGELMEVQQGISLRRNESMIGSTMKVIVDRFEDETYFGRTEYDSPEVDQEVVISAPEGALSVGMIYDMTISDADEFDLYAFHN